jgi:hypothetical protein
MPLSNDFRHVLVSKLQIRNSERTPDYVEIYSLEEIQKIIWSKYCSNNTQYLFQKNSKKIRIKDIMWFSDIDKKESYFCLLLGLGNKNTPDAVYEDFLTERTREFQKEENEGGSFAAHILIRPNLDSSQLYHLALVEKVNGLSTGVITRYLNDLLNDQDYMNEYINEKNNPIRYRPIFEFLGYQSQTLRQALISGILEDIQFVSHELKDDNGFDEYNYIDEQIKQVNLKVSKKIEGDRASIFFGNVLDRFKSGNYEKMYVRIKSDDDKISCQELDVDIDLEKQDILDQFFIQSKCIKEFSAPLLQSHHHIRQDMILKMINMMHGMT